MNNIDEMPPKCQNCPYWETCKSPYVCPTETHEKRTETHGVRYEKSVD